jgi:hypothetical protein
MTSRPRRTTTLSGPNRLVLGAATAGLVALASAGTALLVVTGTSAVAPIAAPAPPLPSSTPLTRAPGVVVLPSDDAGRAVARTPRPTGTARSTPAPAAPADVAPVALPFKDEVASLAKPAAVRPALRRAPVALETTPDRPGRHLAKGHAKHHKHPKLHGKRVGWSHSMHFGNR